MSQGPWWKANVASMRVLLVEDERLLRMMAAEYLQDEGFEITEAWDGDEAIRLLNTVDPFDVVLTDVQMPGTCDGIEVAKHARCLNKIIPLLIVSGYAFQLTTRLRELQPAAVFIGKPYNLVEVADALRVSVS